MNELTLKKLGFFEIIKEFKKYLKSEENKFLADKIYPFNNINDANKEIEITEEFFNILKHSSFPISSFHNLNPIFDEIKKEGSFLQPENFMILLNFFQVSSGVKRFIEELPDDYYKIKTKFLLKIHEFKLLIIAIKRTFDEKGEFLDDASYELKRIRTEIKSIRNEINDKLHNFLYSGKYDKILQDKFVTIRNNRYVLPLKLNFAQKIKGIIQDYSQTRETVFVEPEFVVRLNNKLAWLYQEEYNEKIRILHELTENVRVNLDKIKETYESLKRIDFIHAKAQLGRFMKANPVYLNENQCSIFNALNPILLLTKDKVVPVDLKFENKRVLIVSGANTGGKTVSLKTLGLITLMAQAGFLVPVDENSKIRFFTKIFVEIGDEQDILLDLSSFSAHIQNINSFINECDENTLVLIDELGSGTDPLDGAAIGRAIIEYLLKKNSFAMITTHIQDLKSLNYIYPEVENVAVDFDEKLMKPKYKLIYGVAGKSYGIDIAEKLNMPKEIIELAKKYYENRAEELSKIVKNIEEFKRELYEKERQLIIEKQKANLEKEKFRKLREKLLKEKDSIKNALELKYKKKLEKLLKETNKVFEEAKKLLTAKEIALLSQKKSQIESEVKDILGSKKEKNLKKAKTKIEDLYIGQKVRVITSNTKGKILSIDVKKKSVELLLENNVKINLPVESIEPVKDEKESKSITIDVQKVPVTYSINLIGKTVEEAVEELDRFLDKAILNGAQEVEVIHGVGSGKLKKGIWKYLETKDFVKNFYTPEDRPGGIGITIVELR